MLIKKEFLIFSFPKERLTFKNTYYPLEWKWLNYRTIALLFAEDRTRRSVFERFIHQGFRGIAWHDRNNWASYAWISLPETLGPPHFSHRIKQLPVYWIFYCRTRKEYQGMGLYKASLSLLTYWARKRDPGAEVYIDTEPNNIPSIRGIETVGFLPKGVLTTVTLRLPKFSFVLWEHWDPNASHLKDKG